MSPLKLYYSFREKNYTIKYFPGDCDHNRTIWVNCGRCPACAATWRTQLAQRVRYELLNYKHNACFLTLTVAPEHLDTVFPGGSLDHTEFQKFMKRLRSRLEYHGFKGKIKYFMSGEYGELHGRPHFHVILFGYVPDDLKPVLRKSKKGLQTYKSAFLESVWKFGFVDVGTVTEHTAPYLAKYVAKFKEVRKDEFVVNGKNVKKPYIVYPREIMGKDWFLANAKTILRRGYILTSNGRKCPIPRAYIKLAEKLELEDLKVYLANREEFFIAQMRELYSAGYLTKDDMYNYIKSVGNDMRIKHSSYLLNAKNKNVLSSYEDRY